MLKLLIVDDEYIVRQGMRKILPWEEMDVTLAGEAESIEDAVETARRVCPDIVICDICLPGGEGFLLIDEIRRIVPWVQFIMITAHVDKEYMLRAIYEEVCDYLFKPAKVEDIREAVARAHRKVEAFQEKARKTQGYQNFIMENLDILRENFVVGLLHGTIRESKAAEDARALKLSLEGPAYRLLILRADPMQFYRVMQQISIALYSFHPAAVQLAGTGGDIAVLLNCGMQEEEDLKCLPERIEAEKIWILEKVNRVSDIADLYKKFRAEQMETQKAEQQTYWQENPEQQEIKETLYEAVKYHDSAEEIWRLFELYFDRAEEKKIPAKIAAAQGWDILETVRVLTGVAKDEFVKTEDPKEVQREFEKLCRLIRDNRQYVLDDVSGRALYHIKKRYREDLSLEQLGAELFMSSSYLSRIIKERTGHGFGYWLNYYRIEAAKVKLMDGSKSVEQVSAECGYNSYRIFSENFRKYTGKTASVWRMETESIRKDKNPE